MYSEWDEARFVITGDEELAKQIRDAPNGSVVALPAHLDGAAIVNAAGGELADRGRSDLERVEGWLLPKVAAPRAARAEDEAAYAVAETWGALRANGQAVRLPLPKRCVCGFPIGHGAG